MKCCGRPRTMRGPGSSHLADPGSLRLEKVSRIESSRRGVRWRRRDDPGDDVARPARRRKSVDFEIEILPRSPGLSQGAPRASALGASFDPGPTGDDEHDHAGDTDDSGAYAETSAPTQFGASDRTGESMERTPNRPHPNCHRPFLEFYTTQSYNPEAREIRRDGRVRSERVAKIHRAPRIQSGMVGPGTG